jgi:hypothetical protein
MQNAEQPSNGGDKPQLSELARELFKASDYLTFAEAHAQYPGSPKPATMAVWICVKRYPEFTAIVTYMGNNRRIRRDKWEALLERGFGSKKQKNEQVVA